MKLKRLTGILAALAVASTMTLSANANIADDVINGAEDIVDGVGDAAEDILGGSGDNGNDNDPDTSNKDDEPLVEDTNDEDIPDQVENDADDVIKDDVDADKDDANPSTGVPLMAAGLVALSAAGVAFLSRKRAEDIDE